MILASPFLLAWPELCELTLPGSLPLLTVVIVLPLRIENMSRSVSIWFLEQFF